MINRLCNVIDFVFFKTKIELTFIFSEIMLHTGENVQRQHLIQNCYLMLGNSLLRQKMCIPMGNDPTPFWGNLFLYIYENEYISELTSNDKVKTHHFHTIKLFIDDIGTIMMGLGGRDVLNDVYKYIYLLELKLKAEHSGTYATSLNLDITVKGGVLICKLLISIILLPFLSFACLTLILTSQNRYLILIFLMIKSIRRL